MKTKTIKIILSGRKHKIQQEFINCAAKRIIIKAGRRGGKTVGIANRAIKQFLAGKRVLMQHQRRNKSDDSGLL